MLPEILTKSGESFNFNEPHKAVFTIEDIAHALSHICRFTGHTRDFYCVTPETRILTHDFRWVPAGEIVTGDMLWGFDENAGGRRDLRKWRPSKATVYGLVRRELYEIDLEDGTVLRCSAEHPLLASAKVAGNQRWITAKDLHKQITLDCNARYRPHGTIPLRYLPKFITPWEQEYTWEAGWLAGMFDGEGCLSSKASRAINLNIAQNPGQTLGRIEAELKNRGFSYSGRSRCATATRCEQLVIRGGLAEQLRLLGSIRPQRLLQTMKERLEGREFVRTGDLVPIRAVRHIGKGDVVALETSTHTYITEGFGSHNSVAQHSVMVSFIVPPEHRLAALLHDAAEAFLGDVSSPLKAMLPDYRAIEKSVETEILSRFGISGLPPCVKHADRVLLATEKRDLMPSGTVLWPILDGIEPLTNKILPLNPRQAKDLFLVRYRALMQYRSKMDEDSGMTPSGVMTA